MSLKLNKQTKNDYRFSWSVVNILLHLHLLPDLMSKANNIAVMKWRLTSEYLVLIAQYYNIIYYWTIKPTRINVNKLIKIH